MKTIYDWISVLIFAALVTRFLQQSARPASRHDRLGHYLVCSCGCAGANWLGNHGWDLAAWLVIAATVAYILHFLVRLGRPNGNPPR